MMRGPRIARRVRVMGRVRDVPMAPVMMGLRLSTHEAEG
jgi:hypothetical protein